MHTVQCPHCRRTFRIATAVVKARMKCSACGESFVGSSVESADQAARQASASPPQPARPTPRPISARRSLNPVVIVVCCLCVVGFIGLIGAMVWVNGHPHVTVQDPKTGKIIFEGRISRREAAALRAQYEVHRREEREIRQGKRRPDEIDPGGTVADPAGLVDNVPRPGPTDLPDTPDRTPAVTGDPKLLVSEPTFASASTGTEDRIACGRVRSRYDKPLAWLRVEARAGEGMQLIDRQTFAYIPSNGTVRFSLSVPASVGEADLKIIAVKGEDLPEDLLVWGVPFDSFRRRPADDDGTVLWRGRTRNRTDVPVKDVKVVLDFYDADGVWGGVAEGGLADGETIGVNKTGFLTASSNAVAADQAASWVARVVAKKY